LYYFLILILIHCSYSYLKSHSY